MIMRAFSCRIARPADSRLLERILVMDETLKKVLAYGVIGSVTLMTTVAPRIECEPSEFCEIKSAELPHTHERIPAPTQTVARVIVTASSTSMAAVVKLSEFELTSRST